LGVDACHLPVGCRQLRGQGGLVGGTRLRRPCSLRRSDCKGRRRRGRGRLMDWFVFIVSALAVLIGAVGVVTSRNPVHAALMLVLTLFGVAVLFVAQQAHFLAVVQVIVYAGAIVVLFLFVIMLLGVDQAEDLESEPLAGQRPAAVIIGILALLELFLLAR